MYLIVSYNLQDWSDIDFGISEGVDFIAMSFVNDADSVTHLKNYIASKSSKYATSLIPRILYCLFPF